MNNEIMTPEELARWFKPATKDEEILLEAMASLWSGVESTIHTLN